MISDSEPTAFAISCPAAPGPIMTPSTHLPKQFPPSDKFCLCEDILKPPVCSADTIPRIFAEL
jgi:hypothetical protein